MESPIGQKEQKEMKEIFSEIVDPTLLVLRVHLYTEHLMERIIIASLPRGDRLIEKGRFTYSQKISLISSLDTIEDSFISGLINLNKIRNSCSHERQKKITSADIDFLGRSFSKEYIQIKKETKNEYLCLCSTLGWLCGGLIHSANKAESLENLK